MNLTIKVLSSDIKNGFKGNCYQCPIALALKRILKKTVFPNVGQFAISIDNDIILLPPIAKKFIKQFDTHKTVEAFSFDIEIPNKYLKGSYKNVK